MVKTREEFENKCVISVVSKIPTKTLENKELSTII